MAAGTGRVACVLLVQGKLTDWRMSNKGSKSPSLAGTQARAWIETLEPNVVVTRNAEASGTRGRSPLIVEAMAEAATKAKIISVSLPRPRDFQNKYEEAEALSKSYPDLVAWMPAPRRFFDNEPRNTVLFEALALADRLVRDGPVGLAAAMG